MKEEYLRVVRRIQKMRYFNIRRSGSILCRKCKFVSQTPMLHVQHVSALHPDLVGYCPYCQRELIGAAGGKMSKRSTQHLKFCCFFHKIENKKYRRIFNKINIGTSLEDGVEATDDGRRIATTSILSLCNIGSSSVFLLNVLEYEVHRESIYATPNIQTSPSRWVFIQNFHNDYVMNGDASRYPTWFTLDLHDDTFIRRLVANNRLEFNPSQNIDTYLTRVLSLQWDKFRVFKCVFIFEEFFAKLSLICSLVKNQCIAVTRYIHIYKENNYMIDILIVRPRNDCENAKEILNIFKDMQPINTFDNFIDTCCELSNLNDDPFYFPHVERFNILGLSYDDDVMSMPTQRDINIYNIPERQRNPGKLGYHEFLSPLPKHAAIHFYALTEYGCVHAFNRQLRYNNLINHIADVVYSDSQFVLRYSSFSSDKRTQNYKISLAPGEYFAEEKFYRKHEFNETNLVGSKVFIINPTNIKLVVQTPSSETTVFPNSLFVTDAEYILTPKQIDIYTVAQYNREKILMEANNIPSIDLFCN